MLSTILLLAAVLAATAVDDNCSGSTHVTSVSERQENKEGLETKEKKGITHSGVPLLHFLLIF